MLCQNLIKTLCVGCCLYFLIGNSTGNVYNGKFFNANNDKCYKLNVYYDISYLIDFNLVFHDNLIQKFIQG